MNGLVDARLVKLSQYVNADSDGLLVVTEAGEHVPFHQIQRMFTILAPAGAKRGRHAHRLCYKMTVLIVLCDRPYEEQDYTRNYAEFLSFRKAPRAWRFGAKPCFVVRTGGCLYICLEDEPIGANECAELRLML